MLPEGVGTSTERSFYGNLANRGDDLRKWGSGSLKPALTLSKLCSSNLSWTRPQWRTLHPLWRPRGWGVWVPHQALVFSNPLGEQLLLWPDHDFHEQMQFDTINAFKRKSSASSDPSQVRTLAFRWGKIGWDVAWFRRVHMKQRFLIPKILKSGFHQVIVNVFGYFSWQSSHPYWGGKTWEALEHPLATTRMLLIWIDAFHFLLLV